MDKLLSITVQGKNHKYSFNFYGNMDDVKTWRDEGLEIDVIENTVPVWIVNMGLTKIWCKMQDVFNFKFIK